MIDFQKWFRLILAKLFGWSEKTEAQDKVDAAAVATLKDEKHAVETVESKPVPSDRSVNDSLRSGTF